ncbi:sulfurtransferase [Thioflexithrix psekupsensis]|uniref:Sulfurtransferase n=1 Tax=Thioflexithrix psekupsensis TaxID=1570016 RepID=A0A251XC21_9GAMM|nr:rhodanese-like domain-containing protein [Thioflexithrix psekupsensis]OUD16169.1 sulfurtransferase [Thioflexithrix psekupsensis]
MLIIKYWLKISLILCLLPLKVAIANPDFLVDSDWLSEHKNDEKLIILEVRHHPHRYYTVGHVEGAHQVQRIKDLGDPHASVLTRFPDHLTFQQRLREWGVNDDSLILIYDDSRTVLAARLYFMLELYGFNVSQVKILNGGLLEWSVFEELSQTAPPSPALGNVTLRPANADLLVEWTAVYDQVLSRRDPQVVLLDLRSPEQYRGEVIQNAPRGGHIPGAINIVNVNAVHPDSQKWLNDEEIAALYRDIPKDKTIYVYCDDGFRMALAYLQLKRVGYADVKLYNGGWRHWGSEWSLPVVKGNQPFDDEFSL